MISVKLLQLEAFTVFKKTMASDMLLPNLLQKLMIRLETKDLIGASETKLETGLI